MSSCTADVDADLASREFVDPGAPAATLRLDGFEGPLDLLLDLARRQAVDLRRISLPDLADQYLAAIVDLDRVGLARAADWLVMAAWLTWIKSRLLLPRDAQEAQAADKAAATLTGKLAAIEGLRAAAAALQSRAQLGQDIWEGGIRFEAGLTEHGEAEPASNTGSKLDLAFHAEPEAVRLLRACLVVLAGYPYRSAIYRPSATPVWTVLNARARVRRLLAAGPGMTGFTHFVPKVADDAPGRELRVRSAVASTFVALLEGARAGALMLEQPEPPFGRINVLTVRALDPAETQT